MRIAIYENLPPGGAKRSAYEFGRYLASRHSVDLYQLTITNTSAFDLSPYAARTWRFPFRPYLGMLDRRLRRGQYAPRSLTLFAPLRRLHSQIARAMTASGYDVILAHTDAMTQAPYLLRWTGPQGVYYCHEVLRVAREAAVLRAHREKLRASPPPLGALRVLEDRLVLRGWIDNDRRTVGAAGHIVVNSDYSREQVRSAYGRDASVAPPGVDADRFVPDDTRVREAEVLSIGSPLALKGHDLVIRALSRITPPAIKPRLRIIAGNGEGFPSLQRLARELEVEVLIEERVTEEDLVRRYQAALATVCAARLEPFGLTALESMACGTPVIAIDEAGYRESVIEGETGLLVQPGEAALAEAIARLASDRLLAQRLGRAARASILERWTWRHRGRALEALLEGFVA